MKQLGKIALRLSRPDIMFYALPWLMALLVIGTIAQKEMGLYQAEKLFFSSWLIWFGYLPLPGGLTTLLVIFINLLAKFLFKSTWSWSKSGTIITHFGILLLFVGAIFTALTAREGFLLIPEGQSRHKVLDYHQKVLYIFENEKQIASIPFKHLEQSAPLTLPRLPFQINILKTCKNCEFLRNTDKDKNRKGLADKIILQSIPTHKEDEANLSGISFAITGAGDQDGTYVSVEAAPHPVKIKAANKTYKLQFQRAERELPFTIKLNDFVKEKHPGTQTARHFHSDIEVIDRELSWSTRIEMNQPLRYRGYTFFQSSFAQTPQGEATILAVVKNTGWLFPYIASAVIACGLLLHLLLRFQARYE